MKTSGKVNAVGTGLCLILIPAAAAITHEEAAGIDSVFTQEQFGEGNYAQGSRVQYVDPDTGESALVPTMVSTRHPDLYHPTQVLAWADADSVSDEQSRIAAADPYRILIEFNLAQIPTKEAYRDSLDTRVGQYFTLDADDVVPFIPDEVSLSQNYPNPFNTGTTLEYNIREKGRAWLRVYNASGKQVAELMNGRHAPGKYAINWNPDLPSGAYTARLHTKGRTETIKMVHAR